METQKIIELFDPDYVKAHDERFIHDKDYSKIPEFEIEIIEALLPENGTWLDVGCGTGYFLSQFPHIKRAGLDISENMLNLAKERNPTITFFEGDFREERPQWHDKWDLVSCMWCAYSYVESMTDIDKVIKNLSAWTRKGGACFLPVCDFDDILYGRENLQHYNPDIQIFGGPCYVNGVVWTYIDDQYNKKFENLISPHIEYLIKGLEESFLRVETIYYPPFPFPIPGQRKALLALGKDVSISDTLNQKVDAILKKSRMHKANVLTMEALATYKKTSSNVPIEQHKTGWLRKSWHQAPPLVRSFIKKIIGE